MNKNLEEGQIVLCTVKNIVGATVFVKIEEYNKEGTIVTSEIAPGRIRNLRDYVVPNKKIVCKVLRIGGEHLDLSLRRVTAKEKKELLEFYEREKNLIATLKSISKESEKIIQKIKETSSLTDFFEQAKENPKLLDDLMNKDEAAKLLKILKEKKEKEIFVKKKFSLTSQAEDGIVKIKKIVPADATYLAAGKFLITIKNKNYKEANSRMNSILEEIGKQAKQEGCAFNVEK